MGNCQASEAASVVIQHPGNKIERIYWSLSAQEVMNSNPGHYVALLVTSHSHNANPSTPVLRQVKLLRPDDTLHIGHFYRLITFQEVLKEFAATKNVKLGRLIKETTVGDKWKDRHGAAKPPPPPSKSELDIPVSVKVKSEFQLSDSKNNGGHNGGRHLVGSGQWRPSLHSIAEVGT